MVSTPCTCPLCFCEKCGEADPKPIDKAITALKCESCGHLIPLEENK